MELLKPPRLRKGDTIGLVAACSPLLPEYQEYYQLGVKQLEKLGFKIKTGKTLGLKHWWAGGTPQEQAADIHGMFTNPEVKGIMATSGGSTAISVLELLDYDLIRRHPKPFMGMSDMTAYHLALLTKTGLVGFHMDEVCFGMGLNWPKAEPATRQQAEAITLKILTEAQPPGLMPALKERHTWRHGQASGPLIGGLISRLTNQLGTPYFPPLDWFDGAILFWEAVGLHRFDIYQMLYQLKYHGLLERISGMLVGSITAVQPPREASLTDPTTKEIVLDVCKDYGFPIMAGMDFGHYTVNLPMPLGIRVAMDSNQKTLEFLESVVV